MDAGLETVVAIETPSRSRSRWRSRRHRQPLRRLCARPPLAVADSRVRLRGGDHHRLRAQGVEMTSNTPGGSLPGPAGPRALEPHVLHRQLRLLHTVRDVVARPDARQATGRTARDPRGRLPPSFAASFLRNLLRIVDFLPFGYAVGVTAAVLGSRWQRLGDLAARTWVVREHPEGTDRLRIEPDLIAGSPPTTKAGLPVSPEGREDATGAGLHTAGFTALQAHPGVAALAGAAGGVAVRGAGGPGRAQPHP